MGLKSQNKKVVDCFELDRLVQKTYGRDYCFQQQDGCQSRGVVNISVPVSNPEDYENKSVPEKINGSKMGVSFESWLARDPKEWNGNKEDERFIDLFWERNFYPHLDMVMNDLHDKGLVDAGDYCIEIDW